MTYILEISDVSDWDQFNCWPSIFIVKSLFALTFEARYADVCFSSLHVLFVCWSTAPITLCFYLNRQFRHAWVEFFVINKAKAHSANIEGLLVFNRVRCHNLSMVVFLELGWLFAVVQLLVTRIYWWLGGSQDHSRFKVHVKRVDNQRWLVVNW